MRRLIIVALPAAHMLALFTGSATAEAAGVFALPGRYRGEDADHRTVSFTLDRGGQIYLEIPV